MGVYGKAADDERELNKTLSLGFGHRSGVHVDELIWTSKIRVLIRSGCCLKKATMIVCKS